MGFSNAPNGLTSFGMPVVPQAGNDIFTGNVFFVGSAASNDSDNAQPPGNLSYPFSTINYAISQCTANNGDLIIVLPSHVETLTATATIAANKAGVQIVGVGCCTNRPQINFTATSSIVTVSAANVTFRNINFTCGVDSVVTGISVQAAGFRLIDCDFTSPTSTNDMLIWVLTTTAGTDMTIQGCNFRQNHAGPTECIRLNGSDRTKIINNYITGSYSTAAINSITTLSAEVLISGNRITNSVTDGKWIAMHANATGGIQYNSGSTVSTAGITDANIIVAGKCQLTQNYCSDADGETGKLVGTASA